MGVIQSIKAKFKSSLAPVIATAVIAVITVVAANTVYGGYITIGGKDWRQLSETVSISYDQLDSIYDLTTGELDTGNTILVSGTGVTVDFAGWKWASMSEAKMMYETFLVPYHNPPLTFDASLQQAVIQEQDSAWAPDYFNLMIPTHTTIGGNQWWAKGMTRTLYSQQGTARYTIFSWSLDTLPVSSGEDYIDTRSASGRTLRSPDIGVHLYRTSSVLAQNHSYTGDTLNLDFNLGLAEPATWNAYFVISNSVIPLLSIPLPAIDPPISIPISIPGFPSLGRIGILTTITTATDGIIFIDTQTVDTGQ